MGVGKGELPSLATDVALCVEASVSMFRADIVTLRFVFIFAIDLFLII